LKTTITHRELFNAAHQIEGDPHCGTRLHGHDWFAQVCVTGEPDPKTGSINTDAPKYLWASVAELDRKFANDMLPAVFTTPEGIAMFLFERLRLECPGLTSVTVGFTGHSATVEV
jgi:6-pyruvoyl-tetrahydropterin synthase